ncbi:MAG TPA: MFS transporter [Pseudonocardia sp.]|jgi:MFS family permease|nr:MFS transporter [Pseudonocardia sp.]
MPTDASTHPPLIAPGRATMTRRQVLAAFLLLGAGFMFSVDFSILNVALPRLGAGVGLSTAALPWVVTAFALPAAGFTPLFGRIADLIGRRRTFLTGMALLTAASLLGGAAVNPAMLLTARVLQGFAVAIATPAALSLLVTSFRDPRQRARVLGLNGALLSGGFTVGALAGGTLVDLAGWRSAFLINVPVAVAILFTTPFVVRGGRAPSGVRPDVAGAVTVTLGLLGLVFGVLTRNPWALGSGVALLVAFRWVEQRAAQPLVALEILARPSVKWGNLAGLVVFAMESGLIYLTTLYLQDVLHLSPLATGLVFGVPGLASVAAGVLAGRFIGRHGARRVLAAGLLVQTGATAPLILLGATGPGLALLVPALFVGFFGHVTAIVAFMVTATSGLADSEQGLATGLSSLTQQVGPTLGVPLLSTVAAAPATLLAGVHLALAVDVALSVTVLALVWIGLRPRSPEPVGTVEARTTIRSSSDPRI